MNRRPARHIPRTVRQRWARIEQLLHHARVIVWLTSAEFASCALASATVLYLAKRRAVAR